VQVRPIAEWRETSLSSDPGGDSVIDSILGRLVADLAVAGSGIQFIYATLDTLVNDYGLDDAVIIIEDASLGRQAFRRGGRPVGKARFMSDPLLARSGLHTDPDTLDPIVASSVIQLCQVALQLDVRRHDASHDALTGLFNRRSFDTLLRQSASRSARYGWPFALALIDLDRFKELNDRLGHDEGDRVLRIIGDELRRSLRGGDAAARVGGDEFALILSNGGPEVVSNLITRLEEALDTAMGVDLGFSAGVALAPTDATDPVGLYRLADSRLYDAKGA
jgi:diguanylate cyclase (GGDEF)-like protein